MDKDKKPTDNFSDLYEIIYTRIPRYSYMIIHSYSPVQLHDNTRIPRYSYMIIHSYSPVQLHDNTLVFPAIAIHDNTLVFPGTAT